MRTGAVLCALFLSLAAYASDWSVGPYAYDGAGNIRSIGTDIYTYDEFGRVKSASVAGQNQQFTYDRFGNLRAIQTGTTTIRLGADPESNRLSKNIESFSGEPANAWATYDTAGQLTQWNSTGGSFEYDGVGMITSSRGVPGDADKIYIYTPDDERIATVTVVNGAESTSEWTLRDQSGKVLRRLEKSAEGWRWRQDYIYLNGQLLASEVDTSAQTLHFFLDHLGTPRLITGNGGVRIATHTYLPFGTEATTPSQDTERLKFTGHERDASGLDYMHARYYSAGVGRFLSVDPTLASADLGTPQSWNRYSYVLDNPVRYTDPDGRCTDVWSCAVLGFEVGNVPGAVIGIVGGAFLGYGITHPDEVAALGNNMGGGSAGERFAESWIRQNNANHLAEKQEQENKGTAGGDRAGKRFTPKGKQEIHDRNAQQNGGENRCEGCDRKVDPGKKSQKGVTPPGNERQADHIIPKSKGGDGVPSNGRTLCRDCNIKKSDKDPQ